MPKSLLVPFGTMPLTVIFELVCFLCNMKDHSKDSGLLNRPIQDYDELSFIFGDVINMTSQGTISTYNKAIRIHQNSFLRQHPGLVANLESTVDGKLQARCRLHICTDRLGVMEGKKCEMLPRSSYAIARVAGVDQAPSRALGQSRG